MTNNNVNIELGELKNNAFVVMPFDPLYDTEYDRVIKPAIEEVGLQCVRADEIFGKARIIDDIWRLIRTSRVIVAELTGRNPNVLYEVGLAHAVGKPVIIMTRNKDDVPFDLGTLRYLFYDINDPGWGDNLKTGLMGLLRAVLEEKGLGKYLEGISSLEGLKYQELVKVSASEKAKEENIPDISGLWRGNFNREGEEKHICAMNIDQQGNKLSANMTITLGKVDGEPGAVSCVVQERFTGSISGNNIKLLGVNYYYLQRGEGWTYTLDTFNLVVSSDTTKMRGQFLEKDKIVGKAYFAKRKGKR